jgi:hypothetical protein
VQDPSSADVLGRQRNRHCGRGLEDADAAIKSLRLRRDDIGLS